VLDGKKVARKINDAFDTSSLPNMVSHEEGRLRIANARLFKGGEFLITDAQPEGVFTPEDFTNEQC